MLRATTRNFAKVAAPDATPVPMAAALLLSAAEIAYVPPTELAERMRGRWAAMPEAERAAVQQKLLVSWQKPAGPSAALRKAARLHASVEQCQDALGAAAFMKARGLYATTAQPLLSEAPVTKGEVVQKAYALAREWEQMPREARAVYFLAGLADVRRSRAEAAKANEAAGRPAQKASQAVMTARRGIGGFSHYLLANRKRGLLPRGSRDMRVFARAAARQWYQLSPSEQQKHRQMGMRTTVVARTPLRKIYLRFWTRSVRHLRPAFRAQTVRQLMHADNTLHPWQVVRGLPGALREALRERADGKAKAQVESAQRKIEAVLNHADSAAAAAAVPPAAATDMPFLSTDARRLLSIAGAAADRHRHAVSAASASATAAGTRAPPSSLRRQPDVQVPKRQAFEV